ncbi:MAG: HAD family hydrolase [Butyricicoccaceae bacterium]
MVRAVIFDMDGVLLDTEKHYCRMWMQAAHDMGYPDFTMEHSYHIRSMAPPFAEPYLKGVLGQEFDYYAVREHRRELMDRVLEEQGIEGKPGAAELLDWLNARGIKTAVATATEEKLARERLRAVGMEDKFSSIVSAKDADNVGLGKPAPDVYLFACSRIGERPEDCIAVEDSPNGVQSASDAGIRTVMVPDQTQPDAQTSARLYACVPCLTDLIKIVEEA